MAGKVVKRPIGRPSKYTKELGDKVCDLLEKGWSLRRICETVEGMPHRETVLDWCDARPEFSDQYARSRQRGYEYHADEILDLRNDPNLFKHKNDFGNIDPVPVNLARIYCDNVKWTLSKILPKKYGDKQKHEHSGPDEGPIKFDMSSEPLSEEEWAKKYSR